MLRISKLTDYGTRVMGYLARRPDEFHNAGSVARALGLTTPTVSKILKLLGRAQLLESLRGTNGGYRLVREPEEISVAEVIRSLEGPVALTECSIAAGLCIQEESCSIRPNWQRINQVVVNALEEVSLAEFASPPGGVAQRFPASTPVSAYPQSDRKRVAPRK